MELVSRWLWIILVIVIILLVVHPKSKAKDVIGALSNQVTNNVKTLQGNA
jgi:hypothetical protein